MTVQELLQQEPYLKTDDAKTGIYLIPQGKHGYTAFPVSKQELKKFETALWGGQVSEEERMVDIIMPEAVLVTPDDYKAIQSRDKMWKDGKAVPYTESAELVAAKALVAQVGTKNREKEEAKAWLASKDYISSKISQEFLVGDEASVSALRSEYVGVIAEAKLKRAFINEVDKWQEENELNISAAMRAIADENK